MNQETSLMEALGHVDVNHILHIHHAHAGTVHMEDVMFCLEKIHSLNTHPIALFHLIQLATIPGHQIDDWQLEQNLIGAGYLQEDGSLDRMTGDILKAAFAPDAIAQLTE